MAYPTGVTPTRQKNRCKAEESNHKNRLDGYKIVKSPTIEGELVLEKNMPQYIPMMQGYEYGMQLAGNSPGQRFSEYKIVQHLPAHQISEFDYPRTSFVLMAHQCLNQNNRVERDGKVVDNQYFNKEQQEHKIAAYKALKEAIIAVGLGEKKLEDFPEATGYQGQKKPGRNCVMI